MPTLSQRAYARHRRSKGLNGGTLQAVQQALAAGRIKAEPGGRIDSREADRSWAATTSPRVFASLSTAGKPRGPAAAAWAPPAAQIKRWRTCRDELHRLHDVLCDDWEDLGEPRPPTGSARLDGFLAACDHVRDAYEGLDQALQQYAFASPQPAEQEAYGHE